MGTQVENNRGFTMIEVILVVVIIGILTSVALRSVSTISQVAKIEETKQELDALAFAIAGNPELENNGQRADFGYVGDVGALPPNLDALYANPGSYATWKGPYIQNRFSQTPDDYKKDAWGKPYLYTGGVTITSTGGTGMVRRFANAPSDLLQNVVKGIIYDLDGTPPDTVFHDSVSVQLIIPDGSGGMSTQTTFPRAGGSFSFSSVPVGNHTLRIIYIPTSDTLIRYVTVLPRSEVYGEYYLPSDVWN